MKGMINLAHKAREQGFPIYSEAWMRVLINKGHTMLNTTPNYKDVGKTVYWFRHTQELEADVDTLIDNRRTYRKKN